MDPCRLPNGCQRWPGVPGYMEKSSCAASDSRRRARCARPAPRMVLKDFPDDFTYSSSFLRVCLKPSGGERIRIADGTRIAFRRLRETCAELKVRGTSTNGTADEISRTRSPPCAARRNRRWRQYGAPYSPNARDQLCDTLANSAGISRGGGSKSAPLRFRVRRQGRM